MSSLSSSGEGCGYKEMIVWYLLVGPGHSYPRQRIGGCEEKGFCGYPLAEENSAEVVLVVWFLDEVAV